MNAYDLFKIISRLDAYSGLPVYQLERRLDLFVMIYLDDAFNKKYNATDFKMIYPEWPLFRTTDESSTDPKLSTTNNRANYADYLMYSKSQNILIMVELKTDHSSIGINQFRNYLLNCKEGWKVLWDKYLNKATNNPSYWRKYCYGIDFLFEQAPELTGFTEAPNLREFYNRKNGKGKSLRLQNTERQPYQAPQMKMEFLAPSTCEQNLEHWKTILDPDEQIYTGMISLREYADSVPSPLKELLIKIDSKKSLYKQ
jgi:hypothetical protein